MAAWDRQQRAAQPGAPSRHAAALQRLPPPPPEPDFAGEVAARVDDEQRMRAAGWSSGSPRCRRSQPRADWRMVNRCYPHLRFACLVFELLRHPIGALPMALQVADANWRGTAAVRWFIQLLQRTRCR
jgi:hypothetical protein